jgi:hypothetical protein
LGRRERSTEGEDDEAEDEKGVERVEVEVMRCSISPVTASDRHIQPSLPPLAKWKGEKKGGGEAEDKVDDDDDDDDEDKKKKTKRK